MPPSEATLAEAWRRLIGTRAAVVVAPRSLSGIDADRVDALDALAPASCAAVLWALRDPAPIRALCARLAPGGVLGVVLDPPLGAFARVMPWRAPKAPRAAVCSALLLEGLVGPACIACADGALLAAGATPAKTHWLDAFSRNS